MIEKRFNRKVDALDDIFPFISEFGTENGISETDMFKVSLAIEELFVNMVRHNVGGGSDILIGLEKAGESLTVSLTDFDVEPFDITEAQEYDTGRPLSERPIGRLGVHLVKRMIDGVKYEYNDRQSKITLVKDLGNVNV
ncbi:MAG: ATP-binding protein [Candidatus Eisenbacteria bacterium]